MRGLRQASSAIQAARLAANCVSVDGAGLQLRHIGARRKGALIPGDDDSPDSGVGGKGVDVVGQFLAHGQAECVQHLRSVQPQQ